MVVTSFEFRVRIGEESLQRILQPIQRKIFLDKLSHTECPDLLKGRGSTRSFLILELFHSASQLPWPLFAAILMRPAHLSTRRNVPVSLIYPAPHYTA
jgi:hypothetical protein